MTIVVLKISSLYGCDGYTTDVYDHIKWYVAWRPTLEKDNILILYYQYEISLSRGISEIYDWHSSPLPNPRLPGALHQPDLFLFFLSEFGESKKGPVLLSLLAKASLLSSRFL